MFEPADKFLTLRPDDACYACVWILVGEVEIVGAMPEAADKNPLVMCLMP